MAKVIKITDDIVYIGLENEKMVKVAKQAISWDVKVGEIVDVHQSDDEILVSRHLNKVVTSNNPYAYSGNVVNKIVYIIVAILLGGFGIHKFIVGKTGTGLMFLLFCWTFVPAIIGIIEGVSAISKPADENGNISV